MTHLVAYRLSAAMAFSLGEMRALDQNDFGKAREKEVQDNMKTTLDKAGHASTLTTEKHYYRENADSARLEVVRAFQESTPSSANPPPD